MTNKSIEEMTEELTGGKQYKTMQEHLIELKKKLLNELRPKILTFTKFEPNISNSTSLEITDNDKERFRIERYFYDYVNNHLYRKKGLDIEAVEEIEENQIHDMCYDFAEEVIYLYKQQKKMINQ